TGDLRAGLRDVLSGSTLGACVRALLAPRRGRSAPTRRRERPPASRHAPTPAEDALADCCAPVARLYRRPHIVVSRWRPHLSWEQFRGSLSFPTRITKPTAWPAPPVRSRRTPESTATRCS